MPTKCPRCDLCDADAPNSVIKVPNGMKQTVVIHLCNGCYAMWKEQEILAKREEVEKNESND